MPHILPPQSPEEMREAVIRAKIDDVYGKGFQPPYDDDAPPPRGMRMVKNNLTGRQMNIAKQAAPKDKITGADFKKLQEMLMGRGKADAKVYQAGTGSMEAAVEEVKKQNPEATEEEIVNYLLNPEAGFQEGQRGRTTTEFGTVQDAAPAMTYEQFFRKQHGYYPTVGEIPRAGDTPYFRMGDLANTEGRTFYTDLEDAGDLSNLFRGTVDHGAGPGYGYNRDRYTKSDDLRTVDPNDPTFKGARYTDKRKGAKELRRAVNTADDVAATNKAYADYMKRTQLIQPKGPRLEKTPTGFRVVGTQSQIDARENKNTMGSKMYIR